MIITEADKKYQGMPFTPLIDLFHNADGDPNIKNESIFRVRLFVARTDPLDVKEWVKGFDKKTKKYTSLKGLSSTSNISLSYCI
jgi:hypothetical protein